MTRFTKIDAIRQHLRLSPPKPKAPAREPVAAAATGKRVQKNLSLLERDATRLTALAKRDGISQAQLLSAALDVYEDASMLDDNTAG